jgi:muramidase (phage lysozyme)
MASFADLWDEGSKSNKVSDEDLYHPNVQKGLQYINAYEGSPKANQGFGYREIKDLSDHPNQAVTFNKNGDKTTAAGKYQIIDSTWKDQAKKQGLNDFSEENQDRAAVGILRDTGALDDLKKGDFESAKKKMGTQWSSIPGSTIGKATGQIPKLNETNESILAKREIDPNSTSFADLWESDQSKLEPKTTAKEKQPEVNEGFFKELAKPIGEISKKDWEDKSLAAPVIEYTAGKLGLPGFDADKAEAKLKEKGASAWEAAKKLGNLSPEQFTEGVKGAVKGIVDNPGKFIGETVKSTIYDPEQLLIGGPAGKAGAKVVGGATEQLGKQFAERTGGAMAGVGAAETSAKSMIEQALPEASAELKTFLEKAKNNPNIDKEVIARHIEADKLDVPVRYTEGQATGNANLISMERNERGLKPQLTETFNEQNKALTQNVEMAKDRVAEGVNTASHVEDAENLIGRVQDKADLNRQTISEAYKALDDAGGGKFPVDGKAFADNAMASLKAEDRLDYLPSNIAKKLEDYSTGKKEMNFNLFENLRSDLANDMRKAERAGDGTQKYVLGQVRQHLEDLPMSKEAEHLKPLADKARGLAKENFELEKSNKLYSDVINGKADTSNFIRQNVLNSKNKDFQTAMELVKNDPIALKHLASGTMDVIMRDSIKDGKFLSANFAKAIENLRLNGKLDALFGAKEAENLERIAKTGRIVDNRPAGSYVNESNTTTGAAAILGKHAGAHIGGHLTETLPVIKYFGKPIGEVNRARIMAKEIKRATEIGAGSIKKTKLSSMIGK